MLNKKKIGILTYHRSINYGAVMQAYSLCKRLKRDFPECHVEIIDYCSERSNILYSRSLKNCIKAIVHAPDIAQKKQFTKHALRYIAGKITNKKDSSLTELFAKHLENMVLSDKKIVTDNTDLFFDKINGEYDAIVVGSDAVFNWYIRKFPNPYFLHDDFGGYKFSYAASSYGLEYKSITEEQKRYIKESWDSFDYIGVRDIPTEEFVKYVNPELEPRHNCDPTVFLDLDGIPVSDKEVIKRLTDKGIDTNKPIIGIMGLDWIGKIVKAAVGDRFQIVSVFKDNKYADFFLDNIPPFFWAKVFKFFDVTFTHFFHGNLLSLVNTTPTIVVEKKNAYNINYNSKIRDFMQRIDLLDLCFFEDQVDAETDIKRVFDEVIHNKYIYKKKIKDGLEKEQKYYEDFRDVLRTKINGL